MDNYKGLAWVIVSLCLKGEHVYSHVKSYYIRVFSSAQCIPISHFQYLGWASHIPGDREPEWFSGCSHIPKYQVIENKIGSEVVVESCSHTPGDREPDWFSGCWRVLFSHTR
ncbi:hypothetical protein RRG08_062669 [Elysia crispata]|uniref:Uncharacterized protein n=1 Tax=Elysia crispata TaxID=231223 RepID=A0AAE1DV42_9GAST|nr:hypothetical protein RRG08_062669 [Elysia crispata]